MAEIVGILLAAGDSSRFGSDKLLHPVSGAPIGVAAARNLVRAVPRTLAVVRPGRERLKRLLAEAGCMVIENDDAEAGMGASVAAGVHAARDAGGWLIALADMPWIRPATIAAVCGALQSGASIAAPRYQGARGHPVGFSAAWGDALARLQGRFGARELIAAAGAGVEYIDSRDAGVIRDIDYPGDISADWG